MLIGKGDPEALSEGAPTLADFGAEATRLGGVETLQVVHELYAEGAAELLPPALHPTDPAVVAWLVQRVPCYASPLEGAWYDIGSLESLAVARARFGERG